MHNWRKFKKGPWPFVPQGNTFAYLNNPRWAGKTHDNDHLPCGYWYRQKYSAPMIRPIWEPSAVSFDPIDRILYTICVRNYVGTKSLHKVFATDFDTFLHTRAWDVEGSPRGPAFSPPYFNQILQDRHVWWRCDIGDRYLIPVSNRWTYGAYYIALLDAKNNNIREYILEDEPDYGLVANTTYDKTLYEMNMAGNLMYPDVIKTVVSYSQKRLYVLLWNTYFYRRCLAIGYFDLTETSPPYTWHHLMVEFNQNTEYELRGIPDGTFRVYPDENLIVVTSGQGIVDYWLGFIKAYDTSSGQRVANLHPNTSPIPRRGLGVATLHRGQLYGRVYYHDSQPEYRGLARIHLGSGSTSILKPSYADLEQYNFMDITSGGDRVFMTHSRHGVAEYNIATGVWDLYADWNLEQVHDVIMYLYENRFSFGIFWDPETNVIVAGHGFTLHHTFGPWNQGEPALNWMPTQPGYWGCYLARFPVDRTAQGPHKEIPMIWKMPNY